MFSAFFSLRSHRTPSVPFLDLPSDFLYRVFLHLDNVKDVIALQSTCKRLLEIGRSRAVWVDRLRKEYGLRLKADARCDDKALQNLFRDTVQLSHSVRYWGVYTDGGCDNEWLHYWVDNLFVPNHWESFCSEFGKNVNCVGVLVDGLLDRDVRAQEERNYMIHKCRIPASRVFNEPNNNGGIEDAMKRLQGWSRPELANFMVALYHDMEAGGIWGELLLHGVQPTETAAERIRLRDFVQRLEWTSSVESAGILHVQEDGEQPIIQKWQSQPTPKRHRLLYDSTYTAVAQNQPNEIIAGVIESVTASRHGTFSCPVASGVLFIGQIDMSNFAASHDVMTDALKDLCTSEASSLFDDLSHLDMVVGAVAEKKLPPIHQRRSCSIGQWVEFSSEPGSEEQRSVFSQFRPVVWFHFYSKTELHHGGNQEQAVVSEDDEDFEDIEDSGSDHGSVSSLSDVMSDDDELVANLEDEFVDENLMDDLPVVGDEMDAVPEAHHAPDKDTMVMPLNCRVGGNLVLLKLICPENLMDEFEEHHAEPNIDINSLVLNGKKIALPLGVQYQL